MSDLKPFLCGKYLILNQTRTGYLRADGTGGIVLPAQAKVMHATWKEEQRRVELEKLPIAVRFCPTVFPNRCSKRMWVLDHHLYRVYIPAYQDPNQSLLVRANCEGVARWLIREDGAELLIREALAIRSEERFDGA